MKYQHFLLLSAIALTSTTIATPIADLGAAQSPNLALIYEKRQAGQGTLGDVIGIAEGLINELEEYGSDVVGDLSAIITQIGLLEPSVNDTCNQIQALLPSLNPPGPDAGPTIQSIEAMVAAMPDFGDAPAAISTTSYAANAAAETTYMNGPAAATGPVFTGTPVPFVPSVPAGGTSKRQYNSDIPAGGVNCAGRLYTQQMIAQSIQLACNMWTGYQAGGAYPHPYYNYEGYDFPNAERPSTPNFPYGEYPIKGTSPWQPHTTAGGPGPDRIIFDYGCNFLGLITHTGAAAYNMFVPC